MVSAEDQLGTGVPLSWFPLVPRPRPPGLPLETRIAELTDLATEPIGGTRHDRVSRAAEALNKAALIASDCGLADEAQALCYRQYELFDRARPLPEWAAQLALQPLLNIPRQLIREGRGQDAHAMLETLYRAARQRTTALIGSRPVDLSTVTCAADDHKTVCTVIWAALLADGTRALALAGRWEEAAHYAAARRGTGQRLLDGRQAAILALAQEGQTREAATMVEDSVIAEPWERAVQSLLRAMCLRMDGADVSKQIAVMLADVYALAREQDPSTAVMRTRAGMIALDIAGTVGNPRSLPLRSALIAAAAADAYAARDVIAHQQMRQSLTTDQNRDLHNLVRACGLGSGTIPEPLYRQLMRAVDRAETALSRELKQQSSSH